MNFRLCAAMLLLGTMVIGCAKRVPIYDESGKPISEREIQRHQGSSNFWLYTLGGGALSFGTGFFIGTLVERGSSDSNNDTALWATTTAGTVIGGALFAWQGKKRDRSHAIEVVKEQRKKSTQKELATEKARQDKIESEIRALKALKEKQEAEKRRLLEEIKKKKKDKDEGPN